MQDLLQEQENLDELKSLAKLGEKAAFIIHEIKNPLAGINSVAQILDSKLSANTKEKECIQIILKEISRLSNMTKNFLDFAKMPKPSLKEIEFAGFLRQIIQISINDFKEKNITINTDFYSDNIIIKADPDQIRQAILNILLNAFEILDNNSKIKISLIKQENRIKLLISDNGPGILQENLEKIFEPFFSTKRKGKGVGLAITKKIIQNHGWNVNVESQSSCGCKFTITIY